MLDVKSVLISFFLVRLCTSWTSPSVFLHDLSVQRCRTWIIWNYNLRISGYRNEMCILPARGCGRWAAGWTGGGPAALCSCSPGRPPGRRCPAESPPRSGTGSPAEAGWSPVRFHWVPWGSVKPRPGGGLLLANRAAGRQRRRTCEPLSRVLLLAQSSR